MQYLKESVKQNIVNSALNEFSKYGYKGASMRNIAASADIVSGNIYRYFKNKEDLFESSVGAVYAEIRFLINKVQKEVFNIPSDEDMICSIDVLSTICNAVSTISSEHGTELYILLDKSEGTKYAGCKEEVKNIVFWTLQNLYRSELKKKGFELEDDFMLQVLSSSFIEGMCIILTSGKDQEYVKKIIDKWMIVMFNDLDNRMMQKLF